jgi:hypothetical protein
MNCIIFTYRYVGRRHGLHDALFEIRCVVTIPYSHFIAQDLDSRYLSTFASQDASLCSHFWFDALRPQVYSGKPRSMP